MSIEWIWQRWLIPVPLPRRYLAPFNSFVVYCLHLLFNTRKALSSSRSLYRTSTKYRSVSALYTQPASTLVTCCPCFRSVIRNSPTQTTLLLSLSTVDQVSEPDIHKHKPPLLQNALHNPPGEQLGCLDCGCHRRTRTQRQDAQPRPPTRGDHEKPRVCRGCVCDRRVSD